MPDDVVQETGDAPEATAAKGTAADLDSKLVVEALLFSTDRPLRIADIEEATSLERGLVRSALKKLASDYRRRNTALEVVKVGTRWTMQLRTEFTPAVRTVAPPEVDPRLLKTLALIAFHQPMLQSDLQEMMGPKVYDHVRDLESLGLVNAARKGSTKELTTTQRFPEYFGIGSAKKEDIKRFLAERVGVPLEVPATPEPASPGPAVDAPQEPTEEAPATTETGEEQR